MDGSVPRGVPTHLFSDHVSDRDGVVDGIQIIEGGRRDMAKYLRSLCVAEHPHYPAQRRHPARQRQQQGCAAQACRSNEDRDTTGGDVEIERPKDSAPTARHRNTACHHGRRERPGHFGVGNRHARVPSVRGPAQPGFAIGRVPRELAKHAASLLGSVPDMDKCDVLAAKLAD
jgi:hypothetical protein